MASRFSIGYLLFILAYCLTCSSAAVTSWQEEFEIKMAKMNELIESKNVQLEGKVSEKVTKLEAKLELNVSTFHFLLCIFQ